MVESYSLWARKAGGKGRDKRVETGESKGGVRLHDDPPSTQLYDYVDRILWVAVVIYCAYSKNRRGLPVVEYQRQSPLRFARGSLDT